MQGGFRSAARAPDVLARERLIRQRSVSRRISAKCFEGLALIWMEGLLNNGYAYMATCGCPLVCGF